MPLRSNLNPSNYFLSRSFAIQFEEQPEEDWLARAREVVEVLCIPGVITAVILQPINWFLLSDTHLHEQNGCSRPVRETIKRPVSKRKSKELKRGLAKGVTSQGYPFGLFAFALYAPRMGAIRSRVGAR